MRSIDQEIASLYQCDFLRFINYVIGEIRPINLYPLDKYYLLSADKTKSFPKS